MKSYCGLFQELTVLIMKWFTVHHVVDLKGLFVYSSLISSKNGLVLKRTVVILS